MKRKKGRIFSRSNQYDMLPWVFLRSGCGEIYTNSRKIVPKKVCSGFLPQQTASMQFDIDPSQLLNDLLDMRQLAFFIYALQHDPELLRDIVVKKFNAYFLIIL